VLPRTTSPNCAPVPAPASAPDRCSIAPSRPGVSCPPARCVVRWCPVCRALLPGVSCAGARCILRSGASSAWALLPRYGSVVARSPDLEGVLEPGQQPAGFS